MFGACNCCNESCVIFEDDFTRRAGTPLGRRTSPPFADKGWCDTPGDYYIVTDPTYRARCEKPNRVAICTEQSPDESGAMHAQYQTQNEIPRLYSESSEGQRYRVLVNLVKTNDNIPCLSDTYYFAEYERFGGSIQEIDRSWVRLGVCSQGQEGILKEQKLLALETGLSRTLWAAIDEDSFCAGVTNSIGGTIYAKSPGLFANGRYCGFSLSEKDMLIDDFIFQRHYNGDPPKTRELNCPRCGLCLCDDNTNYGTDDAIELPAELNVCIFTEQEGCERLIQLTDCCYTITFDRIEAAWTHPDNKCCGGFKVRFSCSGESGINKYRLANIGGCQQSGGDSPNRAAIEYKCSSETGDACFVFGPYTIAASDLACACRPNINLFSPVCKYYITVSTNSCCPRKRCDVL